MKVNVLNLLGGHVAPPTKPRAALKLKEVSPLIRNTLLHHPQSRVRHERPHRLAALATSPAPAGEANIA